MALPIQKPVFKRHTERSLKPPSACKMVLYTTTLQVKSDQALFFSLKYYLDLCVHQGQNAPHLARDSI